MADFFGRNGSSNGVTEHRPASEPQFPVLVGADGRPLRGRDKDEMAVGLALPHALTFISRNTGGQGSYWHGKYDEALRFNREYADNMRNDGFLPAIMQERMLAVYALCHSWHLEIPNEKDDFQVRVRDAVTATIKGIPFLGRIIYSLLEAIWYGRYGTQVQWGWTKSPDPQKQKALTILDWLPINGDKIGHQFLDPDTNKYIDQPYVLIDAGHSDELTRNGMGKVISTTQGQALVLQGSWRERFIIHKHLVEDSDWYYSDRAEAIHGVGVRSKVFWPWWLKSEWLANVTDFFDRVGLGVTVWKYPTGNDNALQAVKKAANDQSQRAHIFVPISPDSSKDQSGIERIEVPTTGASFLRELIEYLDKIIERYIVGQEASSKGVSAGMGNEATADFQRDTKSNITLMDSDFLAETLTGSAREPSLVNTILRYTYPEADFPLTWRWDMESGESEKKLTSIKTVVELGVNVKASEVRKAAGLSKPVDGDEVVQGKAAGGMPGMPGADMPPGSPPELGGAATPAGQGGEVEPGSGIPQPGESGETVQGGVEGGAAPSPGADTAAPPTGGDATWQKADTGVSPSTGQPLSDSRYVNKETGTVKHFPDAPGDGENGKPVDGVRQQTTDESPAAEAPQGKQKSAETALAEKSPAAATNGKLDRSAFGYKDQSTDQRNCSTCRFFDGQQSTCHLFGQINQAMPEQFALDVLVNPGGWCDDFESKGDEKHA